MTTLREFLVGTIPSETLRVFTFGYNVARVGAVELLVYVEAKDEFVVYENRCQHQGGRFVRDIEDEHLAICSRHGWKFDARTGNYVNPPPQGGVPCFRQARYRTAFSRDGDLEIYACDQSAESGDVVQFRDGALVSFQKLRELKVGELTITYYGHACVVVKCGDFKIATDPWLVGDCFVGGWYPLHKPPKSWASELATVDMIYISHRHPDHYHPETLKHISKMNPQIPELLGCCQMDPLQIVFCRLVLYYARRLEFGT